MKKTDDIYSENAQMGARTISDWYDKVVSSVDKCPFCDLREKYIVAEKSGVVLTMYDGRTKLSHDVVQEIRRHFSSQVFQVVVPRSVRLAEAPSYGQPINIFAPESVGAQAYADLAREVLEGDGIQVPV